MDFFGAQQSARRKTWQLAALFGAAVLSLIILTNLLVAAVYALTVSYNQPGALTLGGIVRNLPPGHWVWLTFGVVGGVGLASVYKYLQVRGGGRAVAESLGGTLIHQNTHDPAQRRLLNVVEEMAIASGIPVPPVYLISEASINAFAAGFEPGDAVIGVNQGTLDHLSRDELQGVIAHEFSHLLNGDSRLNLRLIAILHGILFIGLTGRMIVSGIGRSGMAASRNRRGGAAGGGLAILAMGLGLLIIGYTGTFFGNLIKAAVSRQREYLADAASVQFTRNPRAIAGALKKIGALGAGSTMSGAAAREASHLFFGQVDRMFLNSLMATHPPLARRIKAVDPRWNGRYPVLPPVPSPADAAASAGEGTGTDPDPKAGHERLLGVLATAGAIAAGSGAIASAGAPETAQTITDSVGQLTDSGLLQAVRLIDGIPEPLRDAAHDPWSACALLYAMVLDRGDPEQLRYLQQHARTGLDRETLRLNPLLDGLHEPARLTLVEMAVPALKELTEPQYRRFIDTLVGLIRFDRKIDLLEWSLHRVLVKELRPHFEHPAPLAVRHHRLDALAVEAATLISALARAGGAAADAPPGSVDAAAREAFAQGLAELGFEAAFETADDPDFTRLNRALAELRQLAPLQKPRLIKACAATVLADGPMSNRQGALLQGIAASLDCPLPPSIYPAPTATPASAAGPGRGVPDAGARPEPSADRE